MHAAVSSKTSRASSRTVSRISSRIVSRTKKKSSFKEAPFPAPCRTKTHLYCLNRVRFCLFDVTEATLYPHINFAVDKVFGEDVEGTEIHRFGVKAFKSVVRFFRF